MLLMTADDGYMAKQDADFVRYIAVGLGSPFRLKLTQVEELCGKNGAGMTAEAMLELFRLHRAVKIDQTIPRRLFTSGRIVPRRHWQPAVGHLLFHRPHKQEFALRLPNL